MNEIAVGIFFWLLKIVGAYLVLLIVLTFLISRWKKRAQQEADQNAHGDSKPGGK